MKVSQITKNTVRARDLIDLANLKMNTAESKLELVQWIAPTGQLYIEQKSEILKMIQSESWK